MHKPLTNQNTAFLCERNYGRPYYLHYLLPTACSQAKILKSVKISANHIATTRTNYLDYQENECLFI